MKQFITFLALIFSYTLCGAQATSLTIDNQNPGWLSSKIVYGDQQTVEELTVSGYLNASDLSFIGSLMQKHNLNQMLDLSESHIVGNGTNKDNEISFDNIFGLTSAVHINLLSMPKSIITPTPQANIKPFRYLSIDTLIYGSEVCPIYNNALWSYIYSGGSGAGSSPKHLILRDGVTAIAPYACDNHKYNSYGNNVKIETVTCPASMKSIGNRAFRECNSLHLINLPDNITDIQNLAFENSGFTPDTLNLPESLEVYYTNSFPIKNGQTIVLGSKINEFNNLSWYLKKTTNVTYIINNVTPPKFTKGASENSYSDGKELSGCTLVVPKDGYSMYADPGYNSVSSTWSGWSNPYSHATLKTIRIPVESISLNYTATSLNVGNSINLVANVLPNNADNKAISWISSNTNVASVSLAGIVTANSPGNATIYAKSNENSNVFQTCEVTVHQPLQSITFNSKQITLNAGQTYNGLTLSFYPATADNKNVIWQSSNTEVATVDSTGKITAIKGGVVKIIVFSEENSNIKDECLVTVNQPVTGIFINKTSIELTEDESDQLIATVLPENASTKNVNWTSSDISIAMVSPDGTIYGIKAGQATIMATTVDGGFVALCKVTVKAKTVLASNIILSLDTGTITIGESMQLIATISPNNTTNKTVNWTSTNPQVATVNSSGLVTAVSEGKSQIVATSTDGSNLSAICEITVEKQFVNISQISITPSNAKLAVGHTLTLNTIITPNNATNKSIVWSSTNPTVATISESGEVTAISDGVATIIASTQDGSNLSATCQISVYTEAILVERIILNPSKIDGTVDDTFEITVSIFPENATNKRINWISTDESIVTVYDGVVKLKDLGSAKIVAKATDGSNVESECTIEVLPEAGITDIIADKNTYVVIYNLSGYLIYKGVYADAKLTPGFYIVKCNGSNIKTRID